MWQGIHRSKNSSTVYDLNNKIYSQRFGLILYILLPSFRSQFGLFSGNILISHVLFSYLTRVIPSVRALCPGREELFSATKHHQTWVFVKAVCESGWRPADWASFLVWTSLLNDELLGIYYYINYHNKEHGRLTTPWTLPLCLLSGPLLGHY